MSIHRAGRGPAMDELEQPQCDGVGCRWEPLVYKNLDGIGVIHRHQPELIEIRRLPQLLGNLEGKAAIARLQGIAWDADVLLGCTRRRIPHPPSPVPLPHYSDR